MANYNTQKIAEIYLDEFQQLLRFIGDNYDWKNHRHTVYIENIGQVTLTDNYKDKKDDKHQVFREVELKILETISEEQRKVLESILSKL